MARRTSSSRPAGARPNDPTLLVLTALASGPKHGHALAKDIEAFAGVRLGPGTLYGAISRMDEQGMIEALPSDDRRRPYRLTDDGRDLLTAMAIDLAHLARTAEERLGVHAPGATRTAPTVQP